MRRTPGTAHARNLGIVAVAVALVTAAALTGWGTNSDLGAADEDGFHGTLVERGPLQLVNKSERSLYAVERGPAAEGTSQAETSSPREPSLDGGGYGFSHSGTVHAFGSDGEMVLYTGGTTAGEYAADLTRLLEDSQ